MSKIKWANTPEEEMTMLIVGTLLAGLLLGSAGAFWLAGSGWLVEHHVLVPATSTPMVPIPGTAGAGLDSVAILAAVILSTLVSAVSSARRAIARRREDLS